MVGAPESVSTFSGARAGQAGGRAGRGRHGRRVAIPQPCGLATIAAIAAGSNSTTDAPHPTARPHPTFPDPGRRSMSRFYERVRHAVLVVPFPCQWVVVSVRRFNGDQAAVRHGIPCVHRKIQERVLELDRILPHHVVVEMQRTAVVCLHLDVGESVCAILIKVPRPETSRPGRCSIVSEGNGYVRPASDRGATCGRVP
jgi:hypothetical protein